jgi:hypothetical protein
LVFIDYDPLVTGHLCTLRQHDFDVWLCLAVCCAMSEEFDECMLSLEQANKLPQTTDGSIRVKFCYALRHERKKEYHIALTSYAACIEESSAIISEQEQLLRYLETSGDGTSGCVSLEDEDRCKTLQLITRLRELKAEIMLRVAVVHKDRGSWEQSMKLCDTIRNGPDCFNDSVKANSMSLRGIITTSTYSSKKHSLFLS